MGIRKTDEQFKLEMKTKDPNIEVLDKYIDHYTKIKFKCKICDNVWYTQPRSILKAKTCCPKCSKIKSNKLKSKSKETFELQVCNNNPNIIILDKYVNNYTKLKCKCKICETEFIIRPDHLLRNKVSCPECVKKSIRKTLLNTTDEIKNKLINVNPNIEILEDYLGIKHKILCKCKICKHTWKANIPMLLRGSSCPNCSWLNRFKTNEEFKNEIYKINSDIELLEEYTDSKTPVKSKCKICGNIFYVYPNNAITTGFIRCNVCNPKPKSIKETYFYETLKTNINKTIKYTLFKNKTNMTNKELQIELKYLKNKYLLERNRQYTINSIRRELDIYLPNLKIGIEFDGNYWHSDNVITKNRSQIKKKEFFEKLGIRVIFIREDEFDYIENKIINRLLSILGLYKKYGKTRKTLVDKDIPYKECSEFLERYHIQGKDNSSIRLGLRTKTGKLVSVMTFSKTRVFTKSKKDTEDTYELLRFCNIGGLMLKGSFSRLLKYAEEILKSKNVKKIKTFADRRFSDDSNNIYLKNGFILSNISEPNYVYIRDNIVLKRYECQKHRLEELLEEFDPSITEEKNMENNKYLKVYDCGNLVYYKNIGGF